MNHTTQPDLRSLPTSPLAHAVLGGLAKAPKRLPPWVMMDGEGAGLYERAAESSTFYLRRIERRILERHGAEIVAQAIDDTAGRPMFVELGAGSARQGELVVRHRADGLFVPTDLAALPLALAKKRLARTLPGLDVVPFAAAYDEVPTAIARLPHPKVVMFLGGGIGRLEDRAAVLLLRGIAQAAGEGAALVLGTDLLKSPGTLVPAYDDPEGCWEAFAKNALGRINRELGAAFDTDRFEHVAVWDGDHGRVDLALRSLVEQTVVVKGVGLTCALEEGELIALESHAKYDLARVGRILAAAGFARERTFLDDRNVYAVHVARVVGPGAKPTIH